MLRLVLISLLLSHFTTVYSQESNFNDRFARISPDGEKVLFESNRVKPAHIFSSNLDGTSLKQMTSEGINVIPNWSPDGKSIIFSRMRDRKYFDPYILNLGTQKFSQLAADTSLNFACEIRNNWLYYSSNRNKEEQLRRVHLITKTDELMMNQGEHHNGISFAPSGDQIAMITKNAGNNWDLILYSLAKKEVIKVFNHPSREDNPEWRPNGNQIIFGSNRDGQWNVHIMNSDGTEVKNLTNGAGNSRFGSWFPDGSRIIFSSDRGGNGYRLFSMLPDGSDVKSLNIPEN